MCKGLLRGETFFKAELSDLLAFEVNKEMDSSPLMVLVLQFNVGKMNKGNKLFGRVYVYVHIYMHIYT